jgi:hypothetical protein
MSYATEFPVASGADRAAFTNQIESLLARLNPAVAQERRRDDRVAIPVLLRLIPLDADRHPIAQDAMIVVGKNISRRGLSFFHEGALPHRRAIIELAEPGLGAFAAEVDVKWCRFTRPGWYESGGRLIRLVSGDHVLL